MACFFFAFTVSWGDIFTLILQVLRRDNKNTLFCIFGDIGVLNVVLGGDIIIVITMQRGVCFYEGIFAEQ